EARGSDGVLASSWLLGLSHRSRRCRGRLPYAAWASGTDRGPFPVAVAAVAPLGHGAVTTHSPVPSASSFRVIPVRAVPVFPAPGSLVSIFTVASSAGVMRSALKK